MNGEECIKAVEVALASGYRHIDTAAIYGNEAEVGEGLKQSGVTRKDVWITTKVWSDNIGKGKLQRSAEASLKALRQDYVDLLLIHWPNPSIPVVESIAALCDAKRMGLARHIGVSNFPSNLLEQAMLATTEPLSANQVEYHPHLDQSKVLYACRKHGLALIAYCPLGRGAVGGVLEEPVIQTIAKAKGRTPAQTVLRWHMQQPGVIAVPKSASPKHIAENLDVFDFTLMDTEMRHISSLARTNGRVVKLAIAPTWD
jgi:diketogulonate reductase-like aldo/keto reductase